MAYGALSKRGDPGTVVIRCRAGWASSWDVYRSLTDNITKVAVSMSDPLSDHKEIFQSGPQHAAFARVGWGSDELILIVCSLQTKLNHHSMPENVPKEAGS